MSGIIFFSVLIYQIYGLIKYIEKTNRDFILFLESIKYSDVSQTYTTQKRGKTFDDLYTAFSDVNAEFRKARAKTEENYRYLHTVIQHVAIGLLSYFPDGKVDFINSAAKHTLKIYRLKNNE